MENFDVGRALFVDTFCHHRAMTKRKVTHLRVAIWAAVALCGCPPPYDPLLSSESLVSCVSATRFDIVADVRSGV